MAKLSSVNKNERRKKLVKQYAPQVCEAEGDGERQVARRGRASDRAPEDGRAAAQREPDPHPQPLRADRAARALITASSVSPACMLRDLANKGLIPGVTKSSW